LSQKRLANSIALMVFSLLFTGGVAGGVAEYATGWVRCWRNAPFLTVMMSGSTKSKIQMGASVQSIRNFGNHRKGTAIDTGAGWATMLARKNWGMNNRKKCVFAALLMGAVCSVGFAQWAPAVNVAVNGGKMPSLAIDSVGDLYASWSHPTTGGYEEINFAYKPVTSDTWTLPENVSRDAYPLRGSVVLVGPGQVPYVVWQSEARAGELYICRRSADTWTLPQRCTTWNSVGSGIRATADRFGVIHVVWHDFATPGHVCYVRYQDSVWGTPEFLTTESSGAADIACDHLGFAHVVFKNGVRDSIGYVRQTDSGWTSPICVPKYANGRTVARARVAVDTFGFPQVSWLQQEPPCFTCWSGDSWLRPVQLSQAISFPTSLCVDRWNRTHVFIGDTGLFERERENGIWGPPVLVDSYYGWGETVVGQDEIHLFWRRGAGAPGEAYLWYSSRRLDPPGIEETGTPARLPAVSIVRNQRLGNFAVTVSLKCAAYVRVELLDPSGRIIRRDEFERLPAGQHNLEVGEVRLAPGAYFCRIVVDGIADTVKLVRVN